MAGSSDRRVRIWPLRAGALCAGMLAVAASAVSAAAAATQARTSALPALFTQGDADRGRQVYAQNCAGCHGADLRGKIGPALLGPAFGSARNHTTVAIMFNVIAFEMPAGAPASLPQADYAAVMAYLLQRNGYPAGLHALTYTAAQAADVPLVSHPRASR
ncbi:c-type cytochrome [Acidisoma sp. 7E03]